MIPVKLVLENFLCYRQPAPLDFAGLHVACLAGDNGAGKSSLLDAITWALWGKARARRDDELIHLGQDEMQVEYTFDLEGTRYRVLRQRKAGKRGRSVLDFQIADADSVFRSISEPSIRQTQAKIVQVLRLDYDTFVNSALLLQGRADEFTLKTAGERKQILADILGLDQWAVYEERAKSHIKAIDKQITLLDARLDEIERELAHEDEYRQALTQTQAQALQLSDALRQTESQLRDLQAARQNLNHTRQQLDDLQRRLAQRARELEANAAEIEQAQARVQDYQDVLAQADAIKAGHTRWAEARKADAAFNARLAEQNTLLQEHARLEAALAEARAEFVARRSALNQQVIELERRAAGSKVETDLQTVRADLSALNERQAERDAQQTRLTVLSQEAGECQANNSTLEAKGVKLNERLERLTQVDEPRCPLCEQALSDERRSELISQLEDEREAMRADWRENQARLQSTNDEIADIRRQLDQIGAELKRLPALQRRKAELAQRLADAQQAISQLNGVQADQSLLQVRLDAGDYALETRQQQKNVQAQLDELGYDAEAHRQIQAELAENAVFEARYVELSQAQEGLAEAQTQIARLQERQSRWQQEQAQDQEKHNVLQAAIAQLESQLVGAAQVEARVDDLRQQESEARMRLGAAQQRLDACQALKKQSKARQAERTQLAEEHSIYDELRVALGKKGVPAMIIEAAIPEIEETANTLLTRMTDGRMHIKLETLRDKVTGGVAETLDIQISDELGTRGYELYSGGEAFRINFAIRIALSQLLARRAGARLRTLVMDEGFGTQDAQGRERLLQAINAIQADFECILVSTHITELKDVFPARIEVSKTPQGSQIEIV